MMAAAAAEGAGEGVSYYEIGFPDVLRPPPTAKTHADSSMVSLHAYLMQYTMITEGQHPIDTTPPTQFLLLNHSMLDEEVANHLSLRLNLPHQECVTVNFSQCGMLSLTPDQVITVRVFNTLLFSFVLGKSFLDSKKIATVENKTKGYYVMPMKDGVDLSFKTRAAIGLIDWTTAIDLVHCKLNLRKWMHYQETPGPDAMDGAHNDTGIFVNGRLRLMSGDYMEGDLIDAFVTYGPWNMPCFIVGISEVLCGSSIIQGNDGCSTYADLWLKRFKFELKHVSQPLLVGYTLSHVGNFLQRPSQEAHWCRAKAKRVEVPPEVCILHTGLKGHLWRGAFWLPSILCGLENALLAVQLRDSIGARISAFKVQEALTSGAYNSYYSYERLELLGDSFLTLMGATALYIKDPSMNKDSLSCSLHSLVENKQLFRCAEACGLASYVFNEPFQVREWIPPGPIPDCLKASEKRVQLGLLRRQRISWRTLADVVEAIVGSYVLDGSISDALKAMSWLKITIDYPESAAEVALVQSVDAASQATFPASCKLADLEGQLKYHFRNHDLVSMALCYYEDFEGGLHFSRLAYLGDCILSHYVARHLITMHQSLDVGTINEMKQSVVNKENLACVAARNKMHLFLTGISSSLRESISVYTATLEKESKGGKLPSAYGFTGLCAPKGLGDLIPSIAAAIFLDCELDGEIVWKILQPLLEPLPKPGCFSLHPINELTQFCKARHLSLDVQSTFQSGIYQAHVIINQETITTFEHEEKRIARKFAAVKVQCPKGKHSRTFLYILEPFYNIGDHA